MTPTQQPLEDVIKELDEMREAAKQSQFQGEDGRDFRNLLQAQWPRISAELRQLLDSQKRWDVVGEDALITYKERDRLKLKNEILKLECDRFTQQRDLYKKQVELIEEELTTKTKRSHYGWTDGPEYLSTDFVNEGSILCAIDILCKIRGSNDKERRT